MNLAPTMLYSDFNQASRPLLKAGYWYFGFAVCAALLLQLIVLPIFLPSLHAGEGMLAGTDSFGFHEIAVALSKAIEEKGWSAWELRPDGQAPAGIAAIFYALICPHPFVMIPINALMHAIAGVVLMRIFLLLAGNKNHAFLAALPFIVFPSALMWYGQIHKDGFYLAGLYMCLLGWILLARQDTWTEGWKGVGRAILWWLTGLALAGLVRIYAFQLLQGIGFLFAAGLAGVFLIRAARKMLSWQISLLAIALLFLMPIGLRYAPKEIRTNAIVYRADAPKTPPDEAWLGSMISEKHWQKTEGVPGFIENNFLRIGVLREGYLTTPDYRTAGSMIDIDVHLYSIGDFIRYSPRAIQTGFAAPFPNDWVAKGSSPGGSIMRKISGFGNVLYVYFTPTSTFCSLAMEKKVEMWIPFTFGTIFILIYAYATPNLGSLYRLRYGFMMILVCLGTLGGLHLLNSIQNRKEYIQMTNQTSNTCRFCSTPLAQNFCNLGFQPLSNSYIKPEANYRGEAFYPLHVEVCHECFLVQLQEFESPEEIFSDYTYFSSYSSSWLKHCEAYAEAMTERFGLTSSSHVIEIASNDGYLLQYFKQRDIPVLGIEPAENVAAVAREKGIETQSRFFGTKTAQDLRHHGVSADLLLGNNVLAHVPDLNDFVAGMKILLSPAGVITMEFPHLLRMMSENQFDTIYHEHFSYLSFYTVERVFARHGLSMFDVEDLPTHGGSIRIYAQHKESGVHPQSPQLAIMREREQAFGISTLKTYAGFEEQARETKRALLDFLIQAKRAGKTIVGYGAPAKGNTLLNYCGIRQDFVDYTVDLSPYKQGTYLPGTHIPVFSPDKIAETKPDYVLILPWNLKDEIMTQLAYVRDWGAKFVIPIPRVEVID